MTKVFYGVINETIGSYLLSMNSSWFGKFMKNLSVKLKRTYFKKKFKRYSKSFFFWMIYSQFTEKSKFFISSRSIFDSFFIIIFELKGEQILGLAWN